jgi:dipeptidyl aminopeptidase/acylaminoacyl peptidase
MIGTKLAHYEITSHLGTGGMGEVYQATDSKLGRRVAIKLLPEAFTHDTERASRFEHEARVLASLNHPKIAAIHGIEESGGRKFLVMELVPGETLAERIKRGPIPMEESLGIATQITEALEAAHEKGVIHRDLKPANIKVTPEGAVKVLDFGLAKAYEAEPPSGMNLSNSPTISRLATQQGVILGTAAYMSPEQARGKSVDRRADIWAFGVVLFEMLTGKQLFEGETVSDTLAAVLEREVRIDQAPTRVRPLLKSCLERDPRKRLRDIGDAWRLLDPAFVGSGLEASAVGAAGRQRRLWLLMAALALAFAAALIPASLYFLSKPGEALEVRFEIQTPGAGPPAISPDGQHIAYVAPSDGKNVIWIRPIDSVTARPLAGTENVMEVGLFWAPESRNLGFFADSKLKKIDVTTGVVQTLSENAPIPLGGAWNNAGDVLFPSVTKQGAVLMRVSSSGGTPAPVTAVTELAKGIAVFPQFLPDGKHFLYHNLALGVPGIVWIGSLDSADSKATSRLMEIPNFLGPTGGDSPVRYASPGYLLFTRGRTLLAGPFDAKHRTLTGDPRAISENVSSFSVSENGTLVGRPYMGTSGSERAAHLLWLNRHGEPAGEVPTPAPAGSLELSRDGQRIAIDSNLQGSSPEVWVIDTRGNPQKLTTNPGLSSFPVWNPAGSSIAFSATRGGGKGLFNLYQKASNAVGMEELVVPSEDIDVPSDWSSDYLVFGRNKSATFQQSDIWLLPMSGADRKPVAFLETPADESQGQISPDGHYIAYVSNESGKDQIIVRTFPDPNKGQWPITRTGGTEPRWRRKDGGELYYLSPERKMMAVPISLTSTVAPGTPVELFPAPPLAITPSIVHSRHYDVTADGQRFLFSAVSASSSGPAVSTPITVVINWTRALKK